MFWHMLQICPYLRNFRIAVADDLLELGNTIQANPHITLERFTLVFGEDQQSVNGPLTNFLQRCGQRINILNLECSSQTFLTFEDLALIANHCPLIDGNTSFRAAAARG